MHNTIQTQMSDINAFIEIGSLSYFQTLVCTSGLSGCVLLFTPGHVGGSNRFGSLPYEGCYDTRVLMGLWSTKAEVEDLVLKAAWQ